MKLKQLQSVLGTLRTFEKPKVNLEQYQTGTEIASAIFHDMSFGDDIRDKVVVDLGCGCGTLAIGASLLGARHCFGFDIDEEAIAICADNITTLELVNVDLMTFDVVNSIPRIIRDGFLGSFDVAVMNPPFGTKHNEGIDVKFLRAAVDLGCHTIYSMHKSSTRQYLLKKARELNLNAEPFARLRFDLPATMRFHRKNNVDIEVDLIRFERRA